METCGFALPTLADPASKLSRDVGPFAMIETELPAIDRTAIEDIRSLEARGKPDRVVRIITLFLAGASGLVGSMRDALAQGDALGVADAAHTLKSSSGFVGARRLMACCQTLERLGRSSNLAEAPPVFARLESEYTAAAAILSRELEKH